MCDRALRALPPTQNDRVWPLYIKFVTAHKIPETAVRVFRRWRLLLLLLLLLLLHLYYYFYYSRYLQMYPEYSEQYVEYLISVDRLDEASQVTS